MSRGHLNPCISVFHGYPCSLEMSRSFDGKRIKKEISSDEEGGRLSDGEVEEENFSADTVRRSRSRSRSRRRGRERTLKPE